MKKVILGLLLLFLGTKGSICEAKRLPNGKITVNPVESIDSLVLTKIILVTDSLTECYRNNFERDMKQKEKLLQRGDSVGASEIHFLTPNSIYKILVVNYSDRYFKKGKRSRNYLQISMLYRDYFCSRDYDRLYWNKSRVRKYGYGEINGYEVLFVDTTNGSDFFKVKGNGPVREIELLDNPYDPKLRGIVVDGRFQDVFEYKSNGDLESIASEYPVIVPMKYDD